MMTQNTNFGIAQDFNFDSGVTEHSIGESEVNYLLQVDVYGEGVILMYVYDNYHIEVSKNSDGELKNKVLSNEKLIESVNVDDTPTQKSLKQQIKESCDNDSVSSTELFTDLKDKFDVMWVDDDFNSQVVASAL